MELDFLSLFAGSSATTTTMAADAMDGGSAPQRPNSEETALASAAWRHDEPRPRFGSAPPAADNLQYSSTAHGHESLLQAPFAPNGLVVAGQGQALGPPPPQDASGFFFAASSSSRGNDGFGMQPTAGVAGAAGLMNFQGASWEPVHHRAAAITAPIRKPAPAADRSTAKVTITCAAGTVRVLENVPAEMVEQFVLAVSKATGAAAPPRVQQPEPAALSSRAQMMALWGLSDAKDNLVPRRAESLVRFLDKRKKRSRANANNLGFEIGRVVARAMSYSPRRDHSTAAAVQARNKSLFVSMEQPGGSGIQENLNYESDDNEALDTELKI